MGLKEKCDYHFREQEILFLFLFPLWYFCLFLVSVSQTVNCNLRVHIEKNPFLCAFFEGGIIVSYGDSYPLRLPESRFEGTPN
jgi:hypothetical protein